KGPKRRETEEHNTYTGREASIPSFSGVPSRPGFRSEWLALEVYPEAGPNLAIFFEIKGIKPKGGGSGIHYFFQMLAMAKTLLRALIASMEAMLKASGEKGQASGLVPVLNKEKKALKRWKDELGQQVNHYLNTHPKKSLHGTTEAIPILMYHTGHERPCGKQPECTAQEPERSSEGDTSTYWFMVEGRKN
ncbi:17902_t:CDS:2, partial [Funneliformis geosporum]